MIEHCARWRSCAGRRTAAPGPDRPVGVASRSPPPRASKLHLRLRTPRCAPLRACAAGAAAGVAGVRGVETGRGARHRGGPARRLPIAGSVRVGWPLALPLCLALGAWARGRDARVGA
eukprot:6285984-Prymnesium_polylepis.1